MFLEEICYFYHTALVSLLSPLGMVQKLSRKNVAGTSYRYHYVHFAVTQAVKYPCKKGPA